jgi:hypothetical protein
MTNQYVMCIDNSDYPVSLDLLRVYRVIADAKADARKALRVVDNSGEDYLYDADRFVPVELSGLSQKAFDALALDAVQIA